MDQYYQILQHPYYQGELKKKIIEKLENIIGDPGDSTNPTKTYLITEDSLDIRLLVGKKRKLWQSLIIDRSSTPRGPPGPDNMNDGLRDVTNSIQHGDLPSAQSNLRTLISSLPTGPDKPANRIGALLHGILRIIRGAISRNVSTLTPSEGESVSKNIEEIKTINNSNNPVAPPIPPKPQAVVAAAEAAAAAKAAAVKARPANINAAFVDIPENSISRLATARNNLPAAAAEAEAAAAAEKAKAPVAAAAAAVAPAAPAAAALAGTTMSIDEVLSELYMLHKQYHDKTNLNLPGSIAIAWDIINLASQNLFHLTQTLTFEQKKILATYINIYSNVLVRENNMTSMASFELREAAEAKIGAEEEPAAVHRALPPSSAAASSAAAPPAPVAPVAPALAPKPQPAATPLIPEPLMKLKPPAAPPVAAAEAAAAAKAAAAAPAAAQAPPAGASGAAASGAGAGAASALGAAAAAANTSTPNVDISPRALALQWRQTRNIISPTLTLSDILQILYNPISNVYLHPNSSGAGRVMGIITLLGKKQFEYFYKTVLTVSSADANTYVASVARTAGQSSIDFLNTLVITLHNFKIRSSSLGNLNNQFYTLCRLLVNILISKINNKKNLITNKKLLLSEIRKDISTMTILNSVKTLNSKLVSPTTINYILDYFYHPRQQIGGNPHLTHLKIDEILDNPVFMNELQQKIAEQLDDIRYDFDNARTLLAQNPLATRGDRPLGVAAATSAPVGTAAAPAPAAAPATVPSAEEDLKNKLVERIVAAIDRSPIPIKLEIKQLSFSNVHNILKSSPLLSSLKTSGGSKKKSRTVTIKSDSMPKTVKGLKTRKKLLKKKIRKMNKRIKLNKKRIVN